MPNFDNVILANEIEKASIWKTFYRDGGDNRLTFSSMD